MMTKPTNPERIDLRDGYYLIRVSKYSFGLMLKGQQHGTIKDYYARILAAAMQPVQPSADAVECARSIYSKREPEDIIQFAAGRIQQYGDARVAELTQRNAELVAALNAFSEIAGKSKANCGPELRRIIQKAQDTHSVICALASQGGKGGQG